MRMEKLEVMAPAGSFESLAAAIQGGADAVYFGVGALNMRSRSSHNFDAGDLRRIADVCAGKGVRSYLAVNTVMFDGDMEAMRRLVDDARAAGVSAVIAADVAVIGYAGSIGMEVHLSTQLNITNIEAVRFYARYADVMVLARELTLEQVAFIKEAIEREGITGPAGRPVRIEMFCHGALCMAVSGKCYLSLHEANASANRGQCIQVCRRAYTVKDRESGAELDIDNKFIMSPKDLKTIHFIDRMLDAGVSVLKIEGRARSPEYVRVVTECYREAVDAYVDGRYNRTLVDGWERRLETVFNRGFWDGYYLGQRLGEWSDRYGSSATKRKVYLARAVKYFGNLGVAEFEMESQTLCECDDILISGPTTGVIMQKALDIRVDTRTASEAVKGDRFSIKVEGKVRPADRLYKIVDADLEGGMV
ncbi:MAG: U32 family peptidase [Tannerellaceae bacterium]|nr:U32 family peptidase [Tannerellaceae bacterium]